MPLKPTNDLSQHPEALNIQMLPPCCWGILVCSCAKQKQKQKKNAQKKWLTNEHAHRETSDALHSQTQPWGAAALVGRWRGCAGCHCCHGSSAESDAHVSGRESSPRRLEEHLGCCNSLWTKFIFTTAEHPGAAVQRKGPTVKPRISLDSQRKTHLKAAICSNKTRQLAAQYSCIQTNPGADCQKVPVLRTGTCDSHWLEPQTKPKKRNWNKK